MEFHRLQPILPQEKFFVTVTHGALFVGQKQHPRDNAHLHDYCEIYFNLEGNVSFAVEGHIYPVQSGDLIITMPNEMHYCIFNADCMHHYFCLWLDADESYRYLLQSFFNRERGQNNRISLDADAKRKMTEYCEVLQEAEQNNTLQSVQPTAALFNLLRLIEISESHPAGITADSTRFAEILHYIDGHYQENCSNMVLCKQFFISRSSLCRLFRQELNTTPTRYIESRRLSNARILLKKGVSVQEACEKSGFTDYSHFIARFKKRFGTTPLHYKKMHIASD